MVGAMSAMSDEVKAQGRRPYIIPGGASNALGALGYVACAQEIIFQNVLFAHTGGSPALYAYLDSFWE